MKTLARTLLVWFVLLAVPFQGFAAAAMRCAHGTGPAVAAQGAGPHGHAAKPPCHQQAAQASQAAGQHDAGEEAPQQEKCGNCAACSVGAAIAPASPLAAPDGCPARRGPAASVARLAAADPDLPERPPRALLA